VAITATWFVARVSGRDSSLIQAFVWAWLNNPITMIPLYYTFYVTGGWMIGDARAAAGYAAFAALWEARIHEPWQTRLNAVVGAVGWPMLVGCLPYASVAALAAYAWTLRVVTRRQRRRRT
jgi:hypothetical protein